MTEVLATGRSWRAHPALGARHRSHDLRRERLSEFVQSRKWEGVDHAKEKA
jgi:hypothetical protein